MLSQSNRFGLHGPSVRLGFVSSPKWIDREGLGKSRTGTRQGLIKAKGLIKSDAGNVISVIC